MATIETVKAFKSAVDMEPCISERKKERKSKYGVIKK